MAKNVAMQLIESGGVPRGWLGVDLAELPDKARFGEDGSPRPGVRVRSFPKGVDSPAKKAGIRLGDIIISFDDQDVMDTANLIRMIGQSPVGQNIQIGVRRGDQEIIIAVKLGRRDPRL